MMKMFDRKRIKLYNIVLKLCEKEGDSSMEQYMPIVWIGFAIFMLLCEGFTTQLVSIWFVLGSVYVYGFKRY